MKLIVLPTGWVGVNIRMNPVQVALVANDVLVVVALPDWSIWPVLSLDLARDSGFVRPYNRSQRPRHNFDAQ
jgi:hypothetical protein